MNTHVLVTGGAGFIGSHAVERLLAAGHRVTVLDDFSTGSMAKLAAVAAHPALTVVKGDVVEPFGPQLAGLDAAPTHILHLAAQVSVARSMDEPELDLRTNLLGTIRAVEYARQVRADKIVLASSAAVYGDCGVPAHEGLVPQPLSPYGLHKLAGEHHLAVAAKAHGLGALSLRFFNVFGPRQDPQSHYAGVISIFIKRALAGEPLALFDSGRATRDFVYVGDIVTAATRALFAGPRAGDAFNVGTGRPTSVRQLAEAVVALTGSRSELVDRPPRAGDVVDSLAQVERIADALGFRAETTLEAGLAATAAFFAPV
jgi:UDP-glucose 4-epimerase